LCPISAVQYLHTILTLVLTNSKVHKLLSDFSLIEHDLLALLRLSKVAKGIHPHPEALVQMNNMSPQDQFITKDSRPVSPNETPELGGQIPGIETTMTQHPKDDAGKGAKVKDSQGEVRSGEQVFAESSNEAQKPKPNSKDDIDHQIKEVQE
jgi:hypothetical protein